MSGSLPRLIHPIVLLMTALACGTAWGQIAVTAPDKPQPRTLKASEAPEELVYQIFFREFAEAWKAAEARAAQGQDPAPPRKMFQGMLALNDAEYAVFASAALQCSATLEEKGPRRSALRQQLRQAADKPGVRAELAQVDRGSREAVAAGVRQLRAGLSVVRFGIADRQVRQHVVSNLKVLDAPSPPAGALGGRQLTWTSPGKGCSG